MFLYCSDLAWNRRTLLARQDQAGRYRPHPNGNARRKIATAHISQIGDRVDFQLGIVVAVDEGVAHVDHALGHIAEDLLSVAQLTGGKEIDFQAHIGRIEIRLDLIECGGPVVADRVLTRNSQANLGAGRQRMGGNQEHRCGNGNPTVQLHLLRSQLILRPCGTVLILGENVSAYRNFFSDTGCQE